MERIEILNAKYPKFSHHYYIKLDPDTLEKKDICFPIDRDIPEEVSLDQLIEKLTCLKKELPQCNSILVMCHEHRLGFEGFRDETDEEFAERKLIITEKNELYNLMKNKIKLEKENDDFVEFERLREKFENNKELYEQLKGNQHARRSADTEGINFRESSDSGEHSWTPQF